MAAYSYLPEDCWEHVMKFLNHRSLESLSIVSKKFLSITNSCRPSFKICDPTIPFLPSLFHRFTNLTSLDLTCFHGDLDTLLRQISFSSMHLKSLDVSNHYIPKDGFQSLAAKMKTLTSLTCSNMLFVSQTDLIIIAECFPFLEELDISFPQSVKSNTDIFPLTLPKLRKVDLSGAFNSHYNIDDSSLFHLCKNSEFLEEIILFGCSRYLTNAGVTSAIRKTPNLKSFSISSSEIDGCQRMYATSKMISSLRNLKGLTCLDLSSLRISDHLLSSLAKEGLPLKRLSLKNCTDYSYAGIFCLLSKCQFLQHLDLQYSFNLNDQYVVGLSTVLGSLLSINLSHCNITELTLLSLVRNCPFLSKIIMEYSDIGKFCDKNSNSLLDFVVYPQVKSLHLARNPLLKNESVKMLASLFPNLQVLDLRYCHCYCISDGIVEVLRYCKIIHLEMRSCSTLNLLSMNFQVSKLEVLNLSKTKIDDETLYVISRSCCGILQLDLERCDHITEKGVRHVVENCTRLREINLWDCHNVCADVNFWMVMVILRSSLRKIMAPSHFCPSDDKWKPLLNHGCLVF